MLFRSREKARRAPACGKAPPDFHGREGPGPGPVRLGDNLIIYGSQVFKLDWVIMSIVILCILAWGLYSLINVLEKQYLKRLN